MRRGGGVHTLPARKGNGWWNEMNGTVLSRHWKKVNAVRRGRAIARKRHLEHTIHRRDGVITQKNSYGHDPCPPRDGQ